MNIVTIMPLKANSERVAGKNFKMLAGRPLFEWAATKALRLRERDWVSTNYIYGDTAVWDNIGHKMRQRHTLLQEQAPASLQDSNNFFADMVEKALAHDFSITHVMAVNATSPFVYYSAYEQACRVIEPIDPNYTQYQYDSALSAVQVRGRVWNHYNQTMNHDPRTCPRTQTQEPVWIESDAFWLFEVDLMLKDHRRVGYKPKFIPMSTIEQIDINVPSDFETAEQLVQAGVSLATRLYS